jgi:predicted nucleic acid-binding protein
MTRRVLLDANMLIAALEPEQGNEEHQNAREQLRGLLISGIEPVITPLVRYEVLRGVRRIPLDEVKAALDKFQKGTDIRNKEADLASEIFRLLSKNQETNVLQCASVEFDGLKFDGPKNPYKGTFDVFHSACAIVNGWEFESRDKDIRKIQQQIQGNQHA